MELLAMKIRKIKMGRISGQLILYCILAFFVWILCGFNTKTVDRETYIMFYEYAKQGINYPGVEIGYCIFQRVCCFFDLPYQAFLSIYSLIAVVLITDSIRKYAKENSVIILVVFLFFPFLHIFVAQRNFMACAIMIYGVRYLVYEKNASSNIKYIIAVFLACSFHTLSIVYFVFIFVRLSIKKIKRIVLICTAIISVLFVFGSSAQEIFFGFLPKLSHYLVEESGTRLETKIFLGMYFCVKLIIGSMVLHYIDKEKIVFMKISMLISFMIPMGTINMNFLRFEYNTLIFFLLSVLCMKKKPKQDTRTYYIVKIVSMVFYIISGYVLLYLFSFESIVLNVLKNNLIL